MPIKLSLDRIMKERGISLTELAGRIGITLANLSIIKTNRGRALRFTTLEALCRELNCQPGDLLEYVNGPVPLQRQKATALETPKSQHRSNLGLPGDYY